MALLIPDLKPPLRSVTACANLISLSDHPDLESAIPTERNEEIASTEDQRFIVRLLRERLDGGKFHFHLDVFAREIVTAKVNCTFQSISDQFDALIGKTLSIGFESKFLLTTNDFSTRFGLVSLLQGVGMNLGGIPATLSGATVNITDSIFREIRWKRVQPSAGSPQQFVVEVVGSLGTQAVSKDLLGIVTSRANEGLNRFVFFGPELTPAKR